MIDDDLYQTYLDALQQGQRKVCHGIVQDLLEKRIPIKTLYHDLFRRSMYKIGELWELNIISVAREHLATAITESLLNLSYPHLFASERAGKKAIISCSANEYHQIGGKMVADMFELNGWDSHFLGANTPPDDMLAFIEETKPDVVGLSLSILPNLENLTKGIEIVRAHFPNQDLMVGGQAFRWGGVETIKGYGGIEYVPSLEALDAFLA